MALTVSIGIVYLNEVVGTITFVWANPEQWLVADLEIITQNEFVALELNEVLHKNRYHVHINGGTLPADISTFYEGIQEALQLLHSDDPDFSFIFPDVESLPVYEIAEGVDL